VPRPVAAAAEPWTSAGLKRTWLGRGAEIDALVAHFVPAHPSHLLLLGPRNAGKSRVLETTLQALGVDFALVSRSELIGAPIKKLYSRLARQLPRTAAASAATERSAEEDVPWALRRRNAQVIQNARFLASLELGPEPRQEGPDAEEELAAERQRNGRLDLGEATSVLDLGRELALRVRPEARFVLVVDRADELGELGFEELSALCKLGEAAGRRVSVVLVARSLTPALERAAQDCFVPALVFPPYPRAVLQQILARDPLPADCPGRDVYGFFLRLAFDVFDERDLLEMRYVCRSLWPAYYGPVARGQVEWNNAAAAHDNLALQAAALARRMWHHDVETAEVLARTVAKAFPGQTRDACAKLEELDQRALHAEADMPFHAKVLLVAAYLASHNSKDSDKVVFGNGTGAKSRASKRQKAQASMQVPAPKEFEIERVNYMFRALLHTLDVNAQSIGNDLYRHLSLLAALRIVQRVSAEGDLGDIKYRYVSTLAVAKAVAKNIKVVLEEWLV
jgi:origin recognition complex subunit 5